MIFLMVIMASGIARGRVRMTTTATTTESRKMAAILFDVGHPCYGQLTPVKTRYLLTRIT